MKMFIPMLCILSLAFAEPPVGDGYALARSDLDHGHDHEHSHDHNHDHNHDNSNDFQRSLSQEYGPPTARSFDASQNSLSTEYGPPSARNANLKSGLSQNYGPPNLRSGLSQEYGAPNARSSSSYSAASRTLSSEYGVPSARSQPSQTYGAPTVRSGASQGIASARSPASQYGVPELRSPSEEYGVPSQRSFGHSPSQKYGPPSARSSKTSLSQEYGVPSSRSGDFQGYSASRTTANSRSFKGSQFGSRSLSTSYSAPAARKSGSYSQSAKSLSQTYGAPNQQDLSDTYEVPSARALSQEYGVPSSYSANQKTSAIASSYAAARSSPSDTYGVPSGRDFMPSEQYGVPEQYDNLSSQGYPNARDALNEILNQEPANYDFGYKVNDYESGSDFGHTETRQDNRAEGSYFVVLPDGTKQVVEYEADERGFKPRISVEPADLGRSGGYDENASDLARSNDGPY